MIGQTVSHYRIIAELGAGGMGIVYEALDTKLDRIVALKFLPPETTRDPEIKTRFLHEARIASALDHPNVCAIHEIDETDDGRLFIAMARYEGQTLKARLAQGPLPVAEALEIARQLAAGLAEAHRQGIVHRDIKPANIFITQDGLIKILDFGLAKLPDQTALTKTGTTLGTVAYMSPEQARGERTGESADIWSTGVTLFEMLAGVPPFAGQFDQAVVYAILNEAPASLAQLRPETPAVLIDIVMRCLDKDPSRRYADAGELSSDLRRVGTTRPAGGGARVSRKVRLVGATVVLIAVAAAVLVRVLDSPPGTVVPRLAIGQFQQHSENPDQVSVVGLMALLNVSLCESRDYNVVSPEYLQNIRQRRLGTGAGPIPAEQSLQIARDAAATHLLTGELVDGGGGTLVTWRVVEADEGRIVKAGSAEGEHITRLADEIARAASGALLDLTGRKADRAAEDRMVEVTANPEAYRYYAAALVAEETGAYSEARRSLLRAVELDSTFAMAHFALSKNYGPQVEETLAREAALNAWRYRERLGRKDRLMLQAHRLTLDFKVSQAISTYDEILANWPDSEETRVSRAGTKYFFWCFGAAYADAREGLDYYPDHPTLLRYMVAIATILGKWDEALAVAQDKRSIIEGSAFGLGVLGDLYCRLGRFDEALRLYDSKLTMEADLASHAKSQSTCAYGRGQLAEAIRIQERALESPSCSSLDSTFLYDLVNTFSMSSLTADAGRPHETKKYFDRIESPFGTYEEVLFYAGLADSATAGLSRSRAERSHINPAIAELVNMYLELRCYAAVGRIAEADSLYREVERWLTKDPDAPCGWIQTKLLMRAHIALARNDPREALEHLSAYRADGILRLAPVEIDILELEAEAQARAGHLDEAVTTLEDLVHVYRGRTLAHYKLGLLYEQTNRTADARAAYETALELWRDAEPNYPYPRLAREKLAALGR